MKDKPYSVTDIARLAGVSVATVSRVLHQSDKVRPETRAQVESVMEQLNFRPNPSAQRIRSRRTGLLGMILPHDFPALVNEMLLAAVEKAAEYGQTVLVSPPFITAPEEASAIANLLDKPLDALLYFPRNAELPVRVLERFGDIPLIGLIRRDLGFDAPTVHTDSLAGGRLPARYLLQLNRRRILFVAGIGSYGSIPSVQALEKMAASPLAGRHIALDRFLGYRQALQEAGVEYDPSLVAISDFSPGTAPRIVAHALASGADGILCESDDTACRVIRLLQDQGISIPEQISVVGYGNEPQTGFFRPALTSVDRGLRSLGEQAVVQANRLLTGEPVQSVCIPAELIVRESTRLK